MINYNIYKCSLLNYWKLGAILFCNISIIAIFTGIAFVSPTLISFSEVVDETRCQNELNVQQITGTQSEFKEVFNNNLLCLFCHSINNKDELFGIKGILINQENIINQINITYSIGYYNIDSRYPCWYDATQNENILKLPKITSNLNGKQVEIQNKTQTFNWDCVQNYTSYACYTQEFIFQDQRNYNRLFGYIFVQGIQYDYMNFALVKYQQSYYQYNEVLLICWIGIELIFGLLIYLIQDEFDQSNKVILIPTLGIKLPLFLIFFFNNHPLFLIQLFYDNNYLKMINIIFNSIAQSGLLFYFITITQRIVIINKIAFIISIFFNIFLCLSFAGLKTILVIYQALEMMQYLPNKDLFINNSEFSYFTLFMIFWYSYFIITQIIVFYIQRKKRLQQIKGNRNDIELKINHKYYKGIWLFQLFGIIIISLFFARVLWLSIVSYSPNYLYYDHYQITLINTWIMTLFFLFHVQNPNELNKIMTLDQEQIEYQDEIEIQQHPKIELEEEEKLHEKKIQQTEEHEEKRTIDTNLRVLHYNNIDQPQTELRK